MDILEKIEYWKELAEKDIPVMDHLFIAGDYNYSL